MVGPLIGWKEEVRGNEYGHIVTTSGFNEGIGFAVSVDWFKPAVEEILLTDRLLRMGKGENVEGGNGGRPSPGWMGMVLVNEWVGIWKFHRYLSEV